MTAGTNIILAALQKIGVHSKASPANAEAIETGRQALNSMIETWISQGIRMGVTPLKVPADELNEPADAYLGVVDNLAINLAADFSANIPPTLATSARRGYRQIRKTYEPVTIPEKIPSSTLPRGQGTEHRQWRYWSPFFGRNQGLES